VNRFDAQFCGQCGNTELTDTSGPAPVWLRMAKWSFYFIALGMVVYFSPTLAQGVWRDLIPLVPLLILVSIIFVWFIPSPVRKTLMHQLNLSLRYAGHILRLLLYGKETKSRRVSEC
jgi:hypothetical protein